MNEITPQTLDGSASDAPVSVPMLVNAPSSVAAAASDYWAADAAQRAFERLEITV